MPGFVKTSADEKKWNDIKYSVAKQRGKSVEEFTDRDWATVNAAWHKSEFEAIKKSITSVPSAMKMPKPKMMPLATDKPSKFFKNEGVGEVKHPSVGKLRDFLENRSGRKQS